MTGIESEPLYQAGYLLGEIFASTMMALPFVFGGLFLYRRYKKNKQKQLEKLR